jgi:hypothetical protein
LAARKREDKTCKKIIRSLALLSVVCILLSPTARQKWERAAQLLVLAQAIYYTYPHFTSSVFLAPLLFYLIFAVIIEVTQAHHEKKSFKMYETWHQIAAARERNDLHSIFYLLLHKNMLQEGKVDAAHLHSLLVKD